MITLKELKWDNCFSYGEGNSIHLNDNTLTQIIGTNGVGKSSIPLILEEVLYNKNSKGVKKTDIPNRNINKGYSIFLSFTKDQEEYEIYVDRKSSIKVKLLCNGEDISSHTATNTYKTIEEIIGVDFKTFSQLVYQNTNASLQFLTATDANRKKFLIDLLKLENYTALYDIFKVASKEVDEDLARLEGKISTINSWLSNNKLTSTMPKPLLEDIISTESDEKELRQLMIDLQNIENSNKKINENNQYKAQLAKIDIDQISKISVNTRVPVDSIRDEIAGRKSELQRITAYINKLSKLGDHCPTCEQDITPNFKETLIETEKFEKESIEKELVGLQKALEEKIEHNSLYELKVKTQAEWESLYRAVDNTLPETVLNAEELETRISAINSTISKAKAEKSKIIKENLEREKYNTRIQVIVEQTEELEKELTKISEDVKIISEKSANLEILKKAFSTNGLIAYKIENLVGDLEQLTNEYLAELSDGRFTLSFVVSNDKLNVEITDNENVVDILALSSGELARVNTATLLAIRKLMSSISKSKINVLFLDEVINVLDENGKEKIVEVLLQEDLNTYLVSHQWQHPLLSKLEIEKRGGISFLTE